MRRRNIFSISRQACDLIIRFTSGKTFSDYKNDPLLRSGVERQLEIIGEALNQAIQHDPEVSRLISNSSRIISFRNKLIHGYATVADEVVWGILETSLPVLNREVKSLL